MRHNLFVYDDDRAFTDQATAFVAEGLEKGEAVMSVLLRHNRELLDGALGARSEKVQSTICEDHYTRPEAALAGYDAVLREELGRGVPGVRLIGEFPDFDYASEAEWDSWVLYEALLNEAFADRPVSVMCVYDSRRLPEKFVADARRAHPHVMGEHGEHNHHFQDPVQVARELTPAARPLPGLRNLPMGGLARDFRELLGSELAAAGVPNERARELLLAADELLANAHRHGDGVLSTRAGTVDGHFVCEIEDRGKGFDDPLAGWLPPGAPAGSGAGLWVARQMAGKLELFPSPAGGLTARVWA